MRRLTLMAVLALALSGCSGAAEPDAAPETAATTTSVPPTDGPEPTASDEETPSPSATADPPHPVSLPALMDRSYNGRGLRLGRVVLETGAQTQYQVSYRSGDLRISGRLAVPKGRGPFPTVVLAHGYIDPAIYVNGQGMTRERQWFADNGYVALHVDYRNHASSDTDPRADLELRLGYTEDVINAVKALRRWDGPVDDDRVAVTGRSMGGGVVYNVLAVRPGLVDAGVVWAPVSSDAVDNFERWIRPDPGRDTLARRIIDAYGDPARPRNTEFWDEASPRTYVDEITEPVLIHHGSADDTCPIRWSRATARAMRQADVDVSLEVYQGEGHAFGPQFFASMERTDRFLDRHLN